MAPEFVEEFLKTIDCYVMGSRTYETALNFEEKGLGWAYGDTPTVVDHADPDWPRHRVLRRTRKGRRAAPRGSEAYKTGMLELRYEVKR